MSEPTTKLATTFTAANSPTGGATEDSFGISAAQREELERHFRAFAKWQETYDQWGLDAVLFNREYHRVVPEQSAAGLWSHLWAVAEAAAEHIGRP